MTEAPKPPSPTLTPEFLNSLARRFSSYCTGEMESLPTQKFTEKDLKVAANVFVNSLEEKSLSLPIGAEGIAAIHLLAHQFLTYIKEGNKPESDQLEKFIANAIAQYSTRVSAPDLKESMSGTEASEAALEVQAPILARLKKPNDKTLRPLYFAALETFGQTIAPIAIADVQNGKFPSEWSKLMEYIGVAINNTSQMRHELDESTRARLHASILLALENMRQAQQAQTEAGVAADTAVIQKSTAESLDPYVVPEGDVPLK